MAAINTSICGKDVDTVWKMLAYVLGTLVFLTLGSLGVRTYRAAAVVPMALLAAVLAMLLVLAAAPGHPGSARPDGRREGGRGR